MYVHTAQAPILDRQQRVTEIVAVFDRITTKKLDPSTRQRLINMLKARGAHTAMKGFPVRFNLYQQG